MQGIASYRNTATRLENEFGFVVYRWDQEYMPYRRSTVWDNLSHSCICPVCTESWDPWISQSGTTCCPFCGKYIAGIRSRVDNSWEEINPVVWSLEKTRYREIAMHDNHEEISVWIPGFRISGIGVGSIMV